MPGSDFLRSENEFNVRLCFVDFEGEKALDLLKDGTQLNDSFVEKAAPRVVEAIQRLKNFARKYSEWYFSLSNVLIFQNKIFIIFDQFNKSNWIAMYLL